MEVVKVFKFGCTVMIKLFSVSYFLSVHQEVHLFILASRQSSYDKDFKFLLATAQWPVLESDVTAFMLLSAYTSLAFFCLLLFHLLCLTYYNRHQKHLFSLFKWNLKESSLSFYLVLFNTPIYFWYANSGTYLLLFVTSNMSFF